ncbi:MAG: c-type cytochrome [Desulforhopalus sp.]
MKKAILALCLSAAVGLPSAGMADEANHHHGENGSHWQAPQEAIDQVNPVPSDEHSIATGKKLFAKYCARCHGKQGLGDGPAASFLHTKPANLQAMSGEHADGDLAWKIRTGKGSMPAWGDELKDDEVWHLVNFIQSLSKGDKNKENHQPSHEHGGHAGHDS